MDQTRRSEHARLSKGGDKTLTKTKLDAEGTALTPPSADQNIRLNVLLQPQLAIANG